MTKDQPPKPTLHSPDDVCGAGPFEQEPDPDFDVVCGLHDFAGEQSHVGENTEDRKETERAFERRMRLRYELYSKWRWEGERLQLMKQWFKTRFYPPAARLANWLYFWGPR